MKTIATKLLATALLGLPLTVLAHSGHAEHGFVDGFAHPLLGLDHLAAMLLVGIWSVLHSQRVWLAPLTFVGLLTLGALAGQHGLALPQTEPLLAVSVLLLGLMLVRPLKPGNTTTLGLIAAFAFCHGLAHGSELQAGSAILSGMLLGSVLLHGSGMALAHLVLRQRAVWAQRLGQGVALFGGGLLLNALF